MVQRDFQVWVPFQDAGNLVELSGRQHHDVQAVLFGGGPEPIHRAFRQPAPLFRRVEGVAQAEHAWLVLPLFKQGL